MLLFLSFFSAADLYIINYLKEFSERMGGSVRMIRILSQFANVKAIRGEIMEFASLNAEGLIQPGDNKCQGMI